MGRKEQCPKCGSKKIIITTNQKECKVCKNTWAEKVEAKHLKKEKLDFREIKPQSLIHTYCGAWVTIHHNLRMFIFPESLDNLTKTILNNRNRREFNGIFDSN